MPPTYKYEFITKGRLKALELAGNEVRELYKQLSKSEVIAPAVLERVRLIRALVGYGGLLGLNNDEIELLEQVLGKDMGEERKKSE